MSATNSLPRVDFNARPLSVGQYEPTDTFREISNHSCVCFADDLGLVATVGRATDPEAQQWADLFAAAPDLLAALNLCLDAIDNHEGCTELLTDKEQAARTAGIAAIARATGIGAQ